MPRAAHLIIPYHFEREPRLPLPILSSAGRPLNCLMRLSVELGKGEEGLNTLESMSGERMW